MKKSISHQKFLLEALHQQDEKNLEKFLDPRDWDSLSLDQQKLLARLFMQKGKALLEKGNRLVVKAFDIACETDDATEKQRWTYSRQKSIGIRCWIRAEKAFQAAAALDSQQFDTWHCWGKALVRLGQVFQDLQYLQEAEQKFEQAVHISQQMPGSIPSAFFWDWGFCHYLIGEFSGEAIDFKKAVEMYSKAAEAKLESVEFYTDYGNVLAKLGALVSDQALFLEAMKWYEKSVKAHPHDFEAVFALACCSQYLWEKSHKETFFNWANRYFETASKLAPEDPKVWWKWGQLLLEAGKSQKSPALLYESSGKLEQADACDQDNPEILSAWGEANTLYGAYAESLVRLQHGEDMLERALEIDSDNPHTWCLHAKALCELGRYFSDERYYQQAIKKFQYGLSLNEKYPPLWRDLALAHFAVGELQDDISMIEKAAKCCEKAILAGGDNIPQYWSDWGIALMKLGEMTDAKEPVETALEKFEQAISRARASAGENPLDPEWFYHYGCALDFLGDFYHDPQYYERAIHILSQLLLFDPQAVYARYNLALALSHFGEATADVESLYKAAELFHVIVVQDEEDEMAWNEWGLALLNLAQLVADPSNLSFAHKFYAQAESKFLQAASLGCSQALYNLACLYSLTGNYSAAIDFIERAQIAKALPPLEDMMYDDWLEGVRSTHAFDHFITRFSKKDLYES